MNRKLGRSWAAAVTVCDAKAQRKQRTQRSFLRIVIIAACKSLWLGGGSPILRCANARRYAPPGSAHIREQVCSRLRDSTGLTKPAGDVRLGFFQARPRKDFARGPVFNQPAEIHECGVIADPRGLLHIMCHDEN